ncbi:MAG: HNH endonuclease [Halioglobus sp.]|nr:HNH endonuclease [Halioglobus sp.]
MASRAPRPCKAPACASLSRDGTGYCPAHKSQSSGWNAPNRGTPAERGYGKQWRKIRDRVMLRDKRLCQPCLEHSRATPATAVDHIIPKAQGGTDEPDNLQAICTPCHRAKTAREGSAGGVNRVGQPRWEPVQGSVSYVHNSEFRRADHAEENTDPNT